MNSATRPGPRSHKHPSSPIVRLKIRVRRKDGARRFVEPVYAGNGKLRPLYALLDGKTEHHPEGVYALRYLKGGVRVFETVGNDSQVALTAKLRVEHTLQGVSLGVIPAEYPAAPSSGKTHLDTAIHQYLDDTAKLKSKKTWSAYSLALKGFRAACPNREHLEGVSRQDILLYMAALRDAGCAPRTVANRINHLKIFYNQLNATWPLLKTDKVKYTDKQVSAYNKEEIAALLRVANQEERDLVLFFLQTGAREQEVQFASWSDIDFVTKTFTVREKLDADFTPKDKEEGAIPIPDALVDALAARRKRYPTTRFIFPARNGKTEGHALRTLKKLALRAGLNCGHCYNRRGHCCATRPVCSRFILHRFRKTFATMHHEAGVPVRTIQQWLRHSSLDVTLLYLAASESCSQEARVRVNATFSSLVYGSEGS